MSPEQAKGDNNEVDLRTDIFALGTILYEVLSGQPAFQGENIAKVVFRVVFEQAAPLEGMVSGLPSHVLAAINKAMAKDQNKRYGSVSEFIFDLTGKELLSMGSRSGNITTPESTPTKQLESAETRVGYSGDGLSKQDNVAIGNSVRARPSDPIAFEQTVHSAEATRTPKDSSQEAQNAASVASPDQNEPKARKFPSGIAALGLVAAIALGYGLWPSKANRSDDVRGGGTRSAEFKGDEIVSPKDLENSDGNGVATQNAADKNVADKNVADKNDADKNDADKNPADKNPADKNPADKNPADKNDTDNNDADKNAADKNAGDKNAGNKAETNDKRAPESAPEVVKPSPAALASLKEARAELKRENWRQARHHANVALRTHKHLPQAREIIAKSYCGQGNIGSALSMMRGLPSANQSNIKDFCSDRGIDL